MNGAYFKVFVEGTLNSTTTQYDKADALRVKLEAEGWTVKVLKVMLFTFGEFETEV